MMKDIKGRLRDISWDRLAGQMNEKGYAHIPDILTKKECLSLTDLYPDDGLYRKTIRMERYRFGAGEYKYFRYPLPSLLQEIRQTVYPYLAPIANGWMEALKIDSRFPSSFEALLKTCQAHRQEKPTVLILKYGEGGFNTLHQDLYGEIYFPIQLVLFLNEPEEDYTGGEFVLTEQIPRAQSKAIVLKPKRGDLLFFTTRFRPVKGSKGYYRVNMKHGISPLHSGQRHTAGIIFHDGVN
jgi:hypothetical protein